MAWTDSPEYIVDLNEIGFVLDSVTRNTPLSETETDLLMNQVIAPKTGAQGYGDGPAKWRLDNCAPKK